VPRVEASKFASLRTWNGGQSRAFEEISYQLLKDHVPAGTRAVRTGNPDGGVEWYVTLADGTEWGWQAKHVHGIDALLTAMTDSVQRVAKERPKLRKLTFAISWNLGTGTSGRERKSQRKKYDDKVAAWKKDIFGAAHLGDLGGEAEALNEVGTLHRVCGNLTLAGAHHRQAVNLARKIASPWDAAQALAGLGRSATAAGRYAEAEIFLRQARDILVRLGAAEATAVPAEPDSLAEA
jgi:tetratricopeptide (TPR) repeat protein